MNRIKPSLKTPITYYGGKQKLASQIVSMLPEHELYCEPFCGGAAVFFAKPKSKVEVINDTNGELVNFYKVVQMDFVALEKEIAISLHSRDIHRKAHVVYTNPDMFSEVRRAWAVWVLSQMGFAGKLDSSFGYDRKSGATSRKIANARDGFSIDLAIRLQDVQIECADALRVIQSRDSEKALFYLDPPYYNSDCGHYDGYSLEDFEKLLKALTQIKGKFVLSSYPSQVLESYRKAMGWHQTSWEQTVSVNAANRTRKKTEVVTWN